MTYKTRLGMDSKNCWIDVVGPTRIAVFDVGTTYRGKRRTARFKLAADIENAQGQEEWTDIGAMSQKLEAGRWDVATVHVAAPWKIVRSAGTKPFRLGGAAQRAVGMAKHMHGIYCKRQVGRKASFDRRSFRWILRGKDTWILVGCPLGHWNARAKHCKVGTQAEVVMTKPHGACPVGTKRMHKGK